jgi:hypothetical protein
LLKDPDYAFENLNRRRKVQQLDSSDNFFLKGQKLLRSIYAFYLNGSGFAKITGMAHLSFGKFPNQNFKPD